MSDAMHPTRLRWDGYTRIGVARHDGVQVELHEQPDICGIKNISELDYVPHVIAIIRIGATNRRDMDIDEMHDALALLQRMAAEARDALDGGSSVVVVSGFGKFS